MRKPTKRNKKILKKVLYIFLIVIISAFCVVLYWLYNNTSLLRGKIEDQDIKSNNSTTSQSPFDLFPQTVDGKTLFMPKGFVASIYVKGIKNARFFTFTPSGTMFVGTKNGKSIYAIPNNNGTAGTPIPVDDKLDTPHSVYFFKNDLYLAEQTRVSVYKNIKDNGTYVEKKTLVSSLPGGNTLTGGGHTTRTVVIGPDEKMYVSIGSSCNVCEESDERRATIMRYELDGSNAEIYAKGLRNTVGFAFNAGILWGLDMGRDQIGDDIPPEEVNIIERGKNYGWPYCYGNKINNPEFKDKKDFCEQNTTGPALELQAHDAPLGISFIDRNIANKWPEFIRGGFVAAMHGSWNRTVPTGYKIIYVDTESKPLKSYNLITGWLDKNGAWGRPVGVGFDPSGIMYISDDKQDLIYKIQYIGQ